ncbi:DUF6452 family protein [Apibacter adventoris]|uniref:Calcium-binding protein P n=1 Tax=Apibacter adventoris TaxID=1679466 RepID=A0A2S8ACS1_9FLAO|nr:DUF6452 family protein [Apibacter adventoris]PQL92633.1 hypothetical protein C4S77_06320 [Apibacter adventoris]
MFSKKINLIIIYILTFSFIYSCVDDDVCDKISTPRLTIAFVDSLNQKLKKDSIFIDEVNLDNTKSRHVFSGIDSIKIPLNALSDKTILYLYDKKSTPDSIKNIITVTYQTEQEYVSKACGFKILYKNVNFDPTRLTNIKKITSNTTQIREESKNLYITY